MVKTSLLVVLLCTSQLRLLSLLCKTRLGVGGDMAREFGQAQKCGRWARYICSWLPQMAV